MTQHTHKGSAGISGATGRLYAILIGSVLLVSATVFFSWYEGKHQAERQSEVLGEALVLLRHLGVAAVRLGDLRNEGSDGALTEVRTNLALAASGLDRINRQLPASVRYHCPDQPLSLTRELDDLIRTVDKLAAKNMPLAQSLTGAEGRLNSLLMEQGRMQGCLSRAMRVESHARFRLHLALVALMLLLVVLLLTLFYRFERRLSATVHDLAHEKEQSARQARDLLRSSSDLRALVEASQDGIFIETVDGRVIGCNRAACVMHGYTREEMLALRVSDLVPPELAAALAEAPPGAANPEGILVAGIGQRKDASLFPTEVSIVPSPLPDDDRVFVYVRDVSQRALFENERKQMQARLQHQQKLESIGTLASGVAHEINNPVNIIINYADLILSRLDKPRSVEEFAREIRHESERIATIVKDLLAFSRQERESHSPAHLEDIITQTLSITRKVLEKDQIELVVDIAPDLPPIKCRSQQIQQVIMNLLTNARDALNDRHPGSHPDKRVTIRAAMHPEREDWVRITVEDLGTGIPARIRERIFDPFFTTKPRDRGTGLGLSVSHGLVSEHRGELTVESEAGAYTRFHIDLRINNGWSLSEPE